MAKGQVSEEELTKGLKGIGNFGGLAPSRVRRDNPFRDSRAEVPIVETPKTIEILPAAPAKRVSKAGSEVAPKLGPKPARPPDRRAVAKDRSETEFPGENGLRKADVFTERVTLQISPEMRDDVERIARELQRAKRSKKERITGNTVMRAAIRLVIERFELKAGEGPNTEEELYRLFEEVFAGGRR